MTEGNLLGIYKKAQKECPSDLPFYEKGVLEVDSIMMTCRHPGEAKHHEEGLQASKGTHDEQRPDPSDQLRRNSEHCASTQAAEARTATEEEPSEESRSPAEAEPLCKDCTSPAIAC